MLLYADDLESLATTRRGRIAIVLSYCYFTALGYPFQDQEGIQGGVARHGDGILQLSARPHGEEGRMASGVAAGEVPGQERHR